MKFHQHYTNNMLLGAPKDMKNCETMPATLIPGEGDAPTMIASFWRPDEVELEALKAGGSVVLYVYGSHHPPVLLAAVHRDA